MPIDSVIEFLFIFQVMFNSYISPGPKHGESNFAQNMKCSKEFQLLKFILSTDSFPIDDDRFDYSYTLMHTRLTQRNNLKKSRCFDKKRKVFSWNVRKWLKQHRMNRFLSYRLNRHRFRMLKYYYYF